MTEVNYGWLLNIFHSGNASLIFALLYMHMYKGVNMSSYRLSTVWYSGLIIILLTIGAGFTGYVLVGSQMSFWAAMVITSLISVVPLGGEILMYFVWGGYSISWLTLQLLFVVHFVLPFIVLGVLVLHLTLLHNSGSTSALYLVAGVEKVTFYPHYWVKDAVNLVWYMAFILFLLLHPYSLGEVELFEEANSLNSPVHIVPEWYFLVSYAILRSVPSKGLGVLIIVCGLLVFFIYPLSANYITPPSGVSHTSLWVELLSAQVSLSYLGISPISEPFMALSLVITLMFFTYHVLLMALNIVASAVFHV